MFFNCSMICINFYKRTNRQWIWNISKFLLFFFENPFQSVIFSEVLNALFCKKSNFFFVIWRELKQKTMKYSIFLILLFSFQDFQDIMKTKFPIKFYRLFFIYSLNFKHISKSSSNHISPPLSQLPLIRILCILRVLTDALPHAIVALLPQAHLVVATRHSQDIARHRPAHIPHNIVERVQHSRRPCRQIVRIPNDNASILRAACYAWHWQSNARCPGNIAHPIWVKLKTILFDPTIAILTPDLHCAIAAAWHKSFHLRRNCIRILLSALIKCWIWCACWTPTDGIAADCMCIWNLLSVKCARLSVAGENRDGIVRAAARENEAVLVRCKCDSVDRWIVITVLVVFNPLAAHLFPDNHFPVVAAARQNVAETRMRPWNLPDGTDVSLEVGFETLTAVLDIEDLRWESCKQMQEVSIAESVEIFFVLIIYLDAIVRRASGKIQAIIVDLGTVNEILVSRVDCLQHTDHDQGFICASFN